MNLPHVRSFAPRLAMRRLVRLGVAVAITLISLVGLANPAAAAAYAKGGNVGVHYLSLTNCRWLIGDRVLTMNVDPPTIYAFNYRAGGGNDTDYVRYQAYLVDYYTGRTLQSTGYSGWALAGDNAPARFAGGAVFRPADTGRYYVDYRIEWYYGGAWVANRVDVMPYYDRNRVGPKGPFNNCLAW
jgi:hypothetical protein